MTQILTITKEQISSLKFTDTIQVKRHPDLNHQLYKAPRLKNTHKRKVNIIFQNDEGITIADTTLWAYGSKYVCIKGDVWIPKNRLIEIEF